MRNTDDNMSTFSGAGSLTLTMPVSQSLSPPGGSPGCHHPLFSDTDHLFEACLLTPQNLDSCPPRGLVAFEAQHVAAARAFVSSAPALREFRTLVAKRKVIERAVIVANEALGSTRHLDRRELHAYGQAHLAFILEMLWMWILDEILDNSASEAAASDNTVMGIADRIARTHGAEEEPAHPDRGDSGSTQGELLKCVLAILDLYERTNPRFRPSGAVFCRAMRRYLHSQRDAHRIFDSWSEYEDHRIYNSGLWSTLMHTAAFLRHRNGVESTDLTCLSGRYWALISRFSIIGAIANDLFGLTKDQEEGITTSFSVLRAQPDPREDDSAVVWKLIRYHNERLRELVAELRSTQDPTARLLLYSALRTIWAVRQLHQECRAIYVPTALRRYLIARSAGDPGARHGV